MKPPEELGLIEQLQNGGFMASLIGMAGMLARILLSEEPGMTWGKAARYVFAAGIVAWLVGQGLKEFEMAQGLKDACIGISGASATNIVDASISWLKKRIKKA
jgi:uncharacterized membrane protein